MHGLFKHAQPSNNAHMTLFNTKPTGVSPGFSITVLHSVHRIYIYKLTPSPSTSFILRNPVLLDHCISDPWGTQTQYKAGATKQHSILVWSSFVLLHLPLQSARHKLRLWDHKMDTVVIYEIHWLGIGIGKCMKLLSLPWNIMRGEGCPHCALLIVRSKCFKFQCKCLGQGTCSKYRVFI